MKVNRIGEMIDEVRKQFCNIKTHSFKRDGAVNKERKKTEEPHKMIAESEDSKIVETGTPSLGIPSSL